MTANVAQGDLDLARSIIYHARKRRQSWQEVADYYGAFSKAAYWRLALDPKYRPPDALVQRVILKGIPSHITPLAIPDGNDAEVFLIPGKQRLHVRIVPDDCAVAIVPEGARIIAPSKRKRPPYKRPTWTQVRQLEAEIARLQALLEGVNR